MIAPFLRSRLIRYGFLAGTALACLTMHGEARSAVPNTFMSKLAVQFCNANIFAYNAYTAFAKSDSAPPVPVPPMLDPPCLACGGPSTPAQQQVTGWVKQSVQPELNDITTLAKMASQINSFGDPSELNAAAQACLAKFSVSAITEAKSQLSSALVNGKGVAMANQYDNEPKQAYAGITLLQAIDNDVAMVSGQAGSTGQLQSYVTTWAQSISDKLDSTVFPGFQYSYCPGYAALLQLVQQATGGGGNASQTIAKMNNFLKFKITMDLHAVGTPASGSDKMDMEWKGTADLTLTMNQAKGCYTPQISGNQVAIQQQSWTLQGKDGDEIDFDGPSSFNAPVQRVTVTLCDASPYLDIIFANYGPKEQATAKSRGHTQGVQLDMFGGMMTTALVGDRAQSGKYSASTGQQAASQLNSLKAQIQAHQGDTAWLTGPQGQAVIKQMQNVAGSATGTGGQGYANGGIVMPGTMMYDLRLNWSNGTATPVDQTVELKHTNGGTLDDELHVTVNQVGQ